MCATLTHISRDACLFFFFLFEREKTFTFVHFFEEGGLAWWFFSWLKIYFSFPFYEPVAENADKTAWFERTPRSHLWQENHRSVFSWRHLWFPPWGSWHPCVPIGQSLLPSQFLGSFLLLSRSSGSRELSGSSSAWLSAGWLCLRAAAGLKPAWAVGRTRSLCCDCSSDTYCVSLPKRTEDKWGVCCKSALRGLFTLSVNDNWRKITCQSVVAAYAVREHISSHLWPTQLCCQNRMELAFVWRWMKKEVATVGKHRQQCWVPAWSRLWHYSWCPTDKVLLLSREHFTCSATWAFQAAVPQSAQTTCVLLCLCRFKFSTIQKEDDNLLVLCDSAQKVSGLQH